MNTKSDDQAPIAGSTPTAKIVTLQTPAPRSSAAKGFLGETPENIETTTSTKVEKAVKPTKSDRKHKAAVRYMQQHGIEDAESIDYIRLNCDIPSDLHKWLNMFSRSGSGEFASMTEIVIEQLGNFAKERGFTVGKK